MYGTQTTTHTPPGPEPIGADDLRDDVRERSARDEPDDRVRKGAVANITDEEFLMENLGVKCEKELQG